MATDLGETLQGPPPETNGVEDILVSDFESRFTFNVDLPPPEDWIEEQRRSFPSDKHRKRAASTNRPPPPRPQPRHQPPPPPPATSTVSSAPRVPSPSSSSLTPNPSSPSSSPVPPAISNSPSPSPVPPPRPSASPVPPPPPPRTSSSLTSASQKGGKTEETDGGSLLTVTAPLAEVQVSFTPTPPHSTPSPPPASSSSLSTHSSETNLPINATDSAVSTVDIGRPRSKSNLEGRNVKPMKRPRANSRPKLGPPRRRPPPPPPPPQSTTTRSIRPAPPPPPAPSVSTATDSAAPHINGAASEATQLDPSDVQVPSVGGVSPGSQGVTDEDKEPANSNSNQGVSATSKQKLETNGHHKMTISDILSQAFEEMDVPLPVED